MGDVSFKTAAFEGPLDLLLHLIAKNKVSIYDIPISEITDQYFEYLEECEAMDMELSSEFAVMAAQLLYIKSKMLLPKPETDDEEDPREDLATRLLLYKKYKEASLELRKTEFATKHMIFRETEKIDFPMPAYSRHHELDELMEAFDMIMSRRERKAAPDKAAFSGIVGREKVSVDDMVEKICNRLYGKRKITFISLFSENISKPEMIATFLAILEMIKLAKIYAQTDENTKELMIVKA